MNSDDLLGFAVVRLSKEMTAHRVALVDLYWSVDTHLKTPSAESTAQLTIDMQAARRVIDGHYDD